MGLASAPSAFYHPIPPSSYIPPQHHQRHNNPSTSGGIAVLFANQPVSSPLPCPPCLSVTPLCVLHTDPPSSSAPHVTAVALGCLKVRALFALAQGHAHTRGCSCSQPSQKLSYCSNLRHTTPENRGKATLKNGRGGSYI